MHTTQIRVSLSSLGCLSLCNRVGRYEVCAKETNDCRLSSKVSKWVCFCWPSLFLREKNLQGHSFWHSVYLKQNIQMVFDKKIDALSLSGDKHKSFPAFLQKESLPNKHNQVPSYSQSRCGLKCELHVLPGCADWKPLPVFWFDHWTIARFCWWPSEKV